MGYEEGAKLIADQNAEVGRVIDSLGALMKRLGAFRRETVNLIAVKCAEGLSGASRVIAATVGDEADPTLTARKQFVAAADRYADLMTDAILELKTMRDKAMDITGHMSDASVQHADVYRSRRIPSN